MKSPTRIVVIISMAVLAASVLLILDIHRASEDEVVHRFHGNQTVIVRQLSREIDQYLRARSQGIQVLSTLASLQHRDMKKMTADIQEYFQYVKKNYVKAISVYDEKGTIINSTTEDAIGRNYANGEFFQWATRSANKGKQFVSSLIRVVENQVELPPYFRFLIVTPIYQETPDPRYPKPTHKFVGVLTVTIDLEEVIAAFLPLVTTNMTKEQVWILDTNGTVLFQLEHPEMVLKSSRRWDETCTRCHVSLDYVEKVLAEKQGTIEYALKERPKKLACFAPLTFENAAWIIVVNVPIEEVSGFLQRQLVRTILLIGLITVAFVGASALIYRSNRLKIRAQEEAKQWREKRELEDRVRKSEEQYRQLVEISPDAIAVHCEGKIVFVNPAAVRLLGATSLDELIGKHALEIVHPDDREIVKQRIAEMLEGRESVPMLEERFLRMDGSIVYVETVAASTTYQGNPAVQVVIRNITERKRAKEVLQATEKRFRALIEKSSDVISLLAADGTILYESPAAMRILGYAFEELKGRNAFELVHPDDLHAITDLFTPFVQTPKATISSQFRFRHKDGSWRWLDVVGTNLLAEPSVQAIIANYRDITEHKRAEERLAKLNECLLSFGADPNENINRLVAFCGEQLQATCALYNRLEGDWLHTLGQWHAPANFVSMDKSDGHICYDVIRSGKEDARVIRDLLHTQYAQTDPNVVRYGLKTYIGKAVSLEGTYVGSLCVVYQDDRIPIKDDLNLLGIVASAVGVEEKRKQTEKTITMLAHAIRSINECVSVTDKANNILFVNDAFLQTYGYDRGELQGKHIGFAGSPNNPPVVEEILPATLRGGWQGELLNRRKDGSEFPISLSTSVVRDDNGEPLALIGVAVDITERKRSEEELKRQLGELERFNKLAVGRELKMIELKKRIQALEAEKGKQ